MQGEKSKLETEVSFPVELLEELTRTVLSGEKDPDLRQGHWLLLALVMSSSNHCIWSQLSLEASKEFLKGNDESVK